MNFNTRPLSKLLMVHHYFQAGFYADKWAILNSHALAKGDSPACLGLLLTMPNMAVAKELGGLGRPGTAWLPSFCHCVAVYVATCYYQF